MNNIYATIWLRTTALLMVMLFSFVALHAQVADTLEEVHVKARRVDNEVSNDVRLNSFVPGQSIITIDSTTLQQYRFQDMANLLSQQVPVFVKSYGMNNVATLNFRGASAAQSQVYWNGVPIQNAALGIADVTLLPVSLMNKVNVVYGSSSALWGSGNVGGALMVENELPDFDDSGRFTQSVSAVAGSFDQYRIGLKTDISTKKVALSANLFGQSARNNFGYFDTKGNKQYMSNATLQSGVGLLQGAYRIDNHNTVTARVWYQQYYREIPPALFETASYKNQRDESLRAMAEWKNQGNRISPYARVAYLRNFMWYRDSAVAMDARNTTNTIYGQAGFMVDHLMNGSNNKLLVFVPVQISWIDRLSTGDRYSQNRYALAATYLFSPVRKLMVSTQARGEVVNNVSYLLPGVNLSYGVSRHVKLRGNLQRTYRVPTLNELYYIPGGNPNLKPEKGWNADVGYALTTGEWKYAEANNPYVGQGVKQQLRLVATHSLSVYDRIINDWILWFGGAIWTPHNISKVHSRGVQTENMLRYRVSRNTTLKFGLNAGYTLATTMQSYVPGDGSIGKQIPYTPRLIGQVNIGGLWKRLYLNYNHSYTGLRYITTDESYSLTSYTQGNLQLTYTQPIAANTLQVTAQCNNIWDARYQVVNARPMPGINWLLGLSFTFDK